MDSRVQAVVARERPLHWAKKLPLGTRGDGFVFGPWEDLFLGGGLMLEKLWYVQSGEQHSEDGKCDSGKKCVERGHGPH